MRSERVAAGRTARWLLLACTILGLAAMHSLGHGSHADGGHGEQAITAAGHGESSSGAASMPETRAVFTAVLAAVPAAVVGGACSGDCHGAGGPGRPRDDMFGFSVCLAVLAAFGIAVLLAWLRVRAPARIAAPARRRVRWASVRAPPTAGTGLRVAALSVMRI